MNDASSRVYWILELTLPSQREFQDFLFSQHREVWKTKRHINRRFVTIFMLETMNPEEILKSLHRFYPESTPKAELEYDQKNF